MGRMKPPPLRYVRPASLEAALELIDGGSRPLAGGQSLMPLLNLRRRRAGRLVDLAAIAELHVLETLADGELSIGAGVTLARLESEPAVRAHAPLLVDALRLVANPQVRARGTVGGNLAHADAVSEVAAALTALGSTATVRGPDGVRSAPVADLRLQDDELLVAVRVPAPPAGHGWAIHEVALRYAARALVVACAVVPEAGAGVLSGARVAVGGVAGSATALAGFDVLTGVTADAEPVAAALAEAVAGLVAAPDPRADEGYRRAVAAELAVRALRDAARRLPEDVDDGDGPPAQRERPAAPPVRPPKAERDGPIEIALTVNDRAVRAVAEPRTLLSDLIRSELGLSATHVGCEHGVCGACNVLLDGVAVRSCLTLAIQADGRAVETLEGLRDTPEVSELADAFVQGHALQCGFCTPGFLVTLAELRRAGIPVTAERLVGNVCRCTGYAPILRAAGATR
jgi:CO/xanthine dehydrogenase FAD-binding subunit/aerobic-type carbon monoxide dehydrogenase small subunit (CoxS/CutS family)